MGFSFRSIYELGGARAPFFEGVAVFCHDCEEGVDDVMGFFGKELNNLIGYDIWSRCLSRGCSLTSHSIVCTSEDFIKGELFLKGFGMDVCVCVRVLGVLPWWGANVVRCGARVFFFKVGL